MPANYHDEGVQKVIVIQKAVVWVGVLLAAVASRVAAGAIDAPKQVASGTLQRDAL